MEFTERYEITHRIGSGGVGAVYQATDRHLGRQVAVKRLLPPDESEDSGQLGSDLLKEARSLSTFQHPNIVTVFDAGEDDDGLYIVMELLQGETLDLAVARQPLSLETFAAVATETLEGLIAAHSRHILHRDLKPSNVYLHNLATGGAQTKLLDFGLAKLSATPSLQTVDQSRSILGSIYFLAPEQFERKPLDARTDLYQLGCLFFFALTGRYAFDGDTTAAVMQAHFDNTPRDLATLRPDLSPGVRTWLLWHLNLDPAARPANAQQSLDTLAHVLAGGAPPDVQIPGSRPAASSPATRPVPVTPATGATPTPSTATQAYLSKLAAKTKPVTTSTQTRRPSGSNLGTKLWIGAVALMTLAFVAVAVHVLTDDGGDDEDLTNTPPPTPQAPSPDASGTPPVPPTSASAPLVDLDAARGTFSDAAETRAEPGDRVAHWEDNAPAAGNNPAQYHVTDHRNPPSRWPLLNATGGRRSLSFDGRRNLLVGRDGGGAPLKPALTGTPVTIAVRHAPAPSPDGADPADRLYLAGLRLDNNARTLDLFLRDGQLNFGFLSHPAREDYSQRRQPAPPGGEYSVTFASADPGSRVLLLETHLPDGTVNSNTSPPETFNSFPFIKELRVAGPGISAGQPGGYRGEISHLRLYNRMLSQDERKSIAQDLNR